MKPQKQHLTEASKTLKSIKRRINEESVSPRTAEFAKKLAKMTDQNQHTEAKYELAKFLGSKKYERIMEAIVEIQDEMGYLDHDLSKFAYSQYKELMALAKQKLNQESYELIYSSL